LNTTKEFKIYELRTGLHKLDQNPDKKPPVNFYSCDVGLRDGTYRYRVQTIEPACTYASSIRQQTAARWEQLMAGNSVRSSPLNADQQIFQENPIQTS
jgi:hypothetical protein